MAKENITLETRQYLREKIESYEECLKEELTPENRKMVEKVLEEFKDMSRFIGTGK